MKWALLRPRSVMSSVMRPMDVAASKQAGTGRGKEGGRGGKTSSDVSLGHILRRLKKGVSYSITSLSSTATVPAYLSGAYWRTVNPRHTASVHHGYARLMYHSLTLALCQGPVLLLPPLLPLLSRRGTARPLAAATGQGEQLLDHPPAPHKQ